jgi:hypothetical protein
MKTSLTDKDENVSRRGLLTWITRVGTSGLLVGVALHYWDRLSPPPRIPVLPGGRPSANPVDWFNLLFGNWDHYSVVPGRHHKDYISKRVIHPDIKAGADSIITPLSHNTTILVPTSEDNMPRTQLSDPLILIGGPFSNYCTRRWQGYHSPKSGILKYKQPPGSLSLRWHFDYNVPQAPGEGPARFVDGELHRSRLYTVIDNKFSQHVRPSKFGVDYMLTTDWLIVSFIPNTLNPTGNNSIVDASDLHGQGNKAFGMLLNDAFRLEELVERLKHKNIRPGRHFQALYNIVVEHKDMHTCLKHSIATHLLDAGADLAFVKDWLGHANIQNTTIYARLTTATLDSTARKVFASHRVV